MSKTDRPSQLDEQLAERVGIGDEDAFAELYERYFQGIYDLAARTLGDREAAADVTQATFAKALEILRRRQPIHHIKPWLYAIARNRSIDELRYRKRLTPVGEMTDEAQAAYYWTAIAPKETSDPQALAIDREVAELVWSAASALSPQDYSLLDLHIRRGLTAEELAESLGLRRGAVYTRLSRLKDSLERSVTSHVMLRQGRRDCPELDAMLANMKASELTPTISKAIQDHVKDCDRCRESKKRYVSPVEILAGLAPLPVAGSVKDLLHDNLTKGEQPPTALQAHGVASVLRHAWRTAFQGHKLLVTGTFATIAASGVAITMLMTSGSAILIPNDPDDVHSISHEIGQASDNNVVVMAWTPEPDAFGYSIEWSTAPEDLPDETVDVEGDASGTSSPSLGEGSWYFHLRTGADDRWTHTVHVGPFIILPEDEEEEATDDTTGSNKQSRDRPKKEVDEDPLAPLPSQGPELPGAPPADEPREEDKPPEDGGPPRDDGSAPLPKDITPPDQPRITSSPADISNDVTPTWSFVGEKGGAFECSLDGGPFKSCESPRTYDLSRASDGGHVFKVRQRDAAGNLSGPASSSFILDTTAPDAPKINSGPPEASEDPHPTWTFTGELGARFECALSDKSGVPTFAPCTSPKTYDLTSAPDGVYTFSVRQTDEAGNVSQPATHSFSLRRGQES